MSKKLLTLLSMALLPLISSAQNFSFVEGNLVEKTIALSEFEVGETKIMNLSDIAVIYEWEMITFDNPFGWDFSICDYTVCYTGGETTGTMASVPAGSETAFIRANIFATSAGVGTYRFVVWDQAIPSEKDTVTFILTAEGAPATLREETPEIELKAHTTLTKEIVISNLSQFKLNYVVMNINGQVLVSNQIGAGEKFILEASNYDSGIYFIQYSAASGAKKTLKLMLR